jgi:hypothetical protein
MQRILQPTKLPGETRRRAWPVIVPLNSQRQLFELSQIRRFHG